MFTTYPTVTLVSLLAITCFYLLILYLRKNRIFQSCLSRYFSSLLFLLFIFHLLTAFGLGGEVADVKLFASAGYALWHKIDIYLLDSSHGTYPFLPFTIYPYALFWFISSEVPLLTFSFLVKTVLIPVLFLTAGMAGKILKKQGVSGTKIRIAQLLLLTNPVLFLAITFHGQADIVLIWFFILSVYLLTISPPRSPVRLRSGSPRRWVRSNRTLLRGVIAGIFYAFSVMTKSWSIIFAPLFLFYLPVWRKKLIFWSTFLLTILVFAQIYKLFVFSNLTRIITTFFSHPSGATGYWGLTGLGQLLSLGLHYNFSPFLGRWRFIIIISGLLASLLVLSKKNVSFFRAAKIFILLVYFLTPGWGLQYSAWIIPFAALDNDWWNLKTYTLASLPYLGLAYVSLAADWHFASLPNLTLVLSFFSWGFCLYWFFKEILLIPKAPSSR